MGRSQTATSTLATFPWVSPVHPSTRTDRGPLDPGLRPSKQQLSSRSISSVLRTDKKDVSPGWTLLKERGDGTVKSIRWDAAEGVPLTAIDKTLRDPITAR